MKLKTLFVASALGLAMLGSGCDRGSHPQEIGEQAPDFALKDDMSSIHLADYKGQVVIVNFWATWCPPCLEELPSLEQFHHAHPEYPILAISIDEDEDVYKQFLKARHVDFLTVREASQATAQRYKVTGWPETFVIGKSGHIRRRFIGATDWNDPEIMRYLRTLG